MSFSILELYNWRYSPTCNLERGSVWKAFLIVSSALFALYALSNCRLWLSCVSLLSSIPQQLVCLSVCLSVCVFYKLSLCCPWADLLLQGCTTSLRLRAAIQKLEAGGVLGRGTVSPSNHLLGYLGSTVSSRSGVRGKAPWPQTHFGVFWALKSHLAATFWIIYLSWKIGNGALWCILKYAYTFGVPNSWKTIENTWLWNELE